MKTETIVLWEAPPVPKVEFRLYYDDAGRVLFYTCEKPAGNYLVIDATTYAQGRPDIRIVDGKISDVSPNQVVAKLMPRNTGTRCAAEDVSIVVGPEYTGEVINWELVVYEL